MTAAPRAHWGAFPLRASVIGMVCLHLAALPSQAQDRSPAVDQQGSLAVDPLAMMQRALGDPASRPRVMSLVATATTHDVPILGAPSAGSSTIEFRLPDCFRWTSSFSLGGVGATFVRGVSRGRAFHAVRSELPNFSYAGPSPTDATELRRQRHAFGRFALLLVGETPSSLGLTAEARGVAVAPDGQRADVVSLAGADGFAARLYLDQASHLPLMLQYDDDELLPGRTEAPTSTPSRGDATHEAGSSGSGRVAAVHKTIFVSEYRAVNGLRMPHSMLFTTDGETRGEWSFTKFAINAAANCDAMR